MSATYPSPGGYPALDCPTCGMEVKVERRGDQFRFTCRGGCGDAEVAGALDPQVMLELGGSAEAPSSGVDAVRRALLEDPDDPRNAEGPAREEVPGTAGLLYRGVAHLLFGDHGEGKSWVALISAIGAADAGERVLYLDRENGAKLLREHVHDVLDGRGEERDWPDRLEIRCHPQVERDWDPEHVGEAVIAAGFTVVIFDSMREFLSALGLDENSTPDVSAFYTGFVTPLVRRGAAVVLLDNVGHDEKGRPRGANSKLDAAPQGFNVRTSAPFSPVERGAVTVECKRSRYGDVGREWTLPIGGGTYGQPKERGEQPTEKRAREAREGLERFRRLVLAVLEEKQPLGRDALIEAARERGAKGRATKLRDWLAELAADPTSGLVKDEGGYHLTPGPENRDHPGTTPSEGPRSRPGHTPRRGVPGGPPLVPPDRTTPDTSDFEPAVCRGLHGPNPHRPAPSPRTGGPSICMTCKKPLGGPWGAV